MNGIERMIREPVVDTYSETNKELVRRLLPKRTRNSHKGTYGRAAIVAGSIEYTGAAYLSTAACLRSGVGYTTLFLPGDILPYYIGKAPEALLKSTNEGGRYAFNEEHMRELLGYDAVAYGMGMGVSEEVFLGAAYLLTRYEGKLILDADGLNSLAAFGEISTLFQRKKCQLVITPHAKEFSRLTSTSVDKVLEKGKKLAEEFAVDYQTTVLLKGADSLITDGKQRLINTTGNSGQAKGGTGDVLSGVIVGLCAQGLSTLDGAIVGAYLVGKSAELVAVKLGEYSMTASDIILHLGGAFLSVLED